MSADTDFSSVIQTTNPTNSSLTTPEISTSDSEMTNKSLSHFQTEMTSKPNETESNSNNPSFSDKTIFTTTDLFKTSAPTFIHDSSSSSFFDSDSEPKTSFFSTQTYQTTLPFNRHKNNSIILNN